jgi:N-methylhydantoinase B
MSRRFDPIRLGVLNHLFASIAEEMGASLMRAAFSVNIKERRDLSCAVFDGEGRLVAHAAHIPVHLGSTPTCVRAVLDALRLGPGDVAIVNDPYAGGTHLPDITLVSPVYGGGGRRPLFYVANRAHHADVGGITAGSMPLARHIDEEGVRIPPTKLQVRGRLDGEFLSRFLARVRTPEEREGDLRAQLAANHTAEARLRAARLKYGTAALERGIEALLDYSERMTRHAIRALPAGTTRFADVLDDDGLGTRDIPIRVAVTLRGGRARVDFTGSAPQVAGGVNAVHAVTLSAVTYVFRCLAGAEVPSNAGGMRPVTVVAPEGSVVNARFPAPVAGGNVETSQRVVDVVLGALAQAAPDRFPAASCGTMSNVTLGGRDAGGAAFAYYETVAGGMGARPGQDGLAGVQTHMTNTRNTPVEAIEHAFPFRIRRYAIRRGSGGAGRWRGGDGVIREYETRVPTEVTLLGERRIRAPWGLQGGAPGARGEDVLGTAAGDRRLPGKGTFTLSPDETLSIRTPGGGGWARPSGSRRAKPSGLAHATRRAKTVPHAKPSGRAKTTRRVKGMHARKSRPATRERSSTR